MPLHVGVAYALPERQMWLELEVPDGSTVLEAVRWSGILDHFPEIDIRKLKVGVFGKLTKLDAPLHDAAAG